MLGVLTLVNTAKQFLKVIVSNYILSNVYVCTAARLSPLHLRDIQFVSNFFVIININVQICGKHRFSFHLGKHYEWDG